MTTMNDSFWKSPMLKPGDYRWWAEQFEAHTCSLDGQLWQVIEQGAEKIPNTTDPTKEKDRKDYTDADYKILEKKPDDEMIAVLTRALKMAGTAPKRSFKGTASNKDSLCYHCQKKGHMGKNCSSKKAGEPPAQKSVKAMVATWGESDEDSEEDNPTGAVCIMATNEVSDSDPFAYLIDRTNEQLISLIKKFVKKNMELTQEMREHEESTTAVEENGSLWANKALQLEEELSQNGTKLTKQLRKLEKRLNNLNTQNESLQTELDDIRSLEGKVTQLEEENPKLMKEVEVTKVNEEELKKKWLKKYKDTKVSEIKEGFAKHFTSRPGLGYNSEAENKVSKKGKEVDQVSKKPSKCKCGATQGMTEQTAARSTVPFDGKKAYTLWLKQEANLHTLTLLHEWPISRSHQEEVSMWT
ncbi:unnamed protein product [Rhodiola kirilowii]